MLRIAAVPAALGLSGMLFAQQITDVDADLEPVRQYRVEIILFTYDNSISAGTEVFPPENEPLPFGAQPLGGPRDRIADPPDTAQPDAAPITDDEAPVFSDMDLLPAIGMDSDVEIEEILSESQISLRVLQQDELTMTAEHERLLQIDAYQPVLWSGWQQIAHDEAVTPPLRLRRLGNLPLSFDGTIKFYLGRFLHLDLDVTLEERHRVTTSTPRYPDERDRRGTRRRPAPESVAVKYRIREDRIVKTSETRYFDHPKFGLIARVARIETTEEPLPQDADSAIQPGGSSGSR